MLPANSFLAGLAVILDWGLTIYIWIVVVRVLISWVNPNPYNPVVQFLAKITDPVLVPIRRLLPVSYGGIDFSPIVLLLLLNFLEFFLVTSLIGLGGAGGVGAMNPFRGLAYGMPVSGLLPIFIISVIHLIQGLLYALMIIIIVRAVLSWISPDPYNPIVRFVYGITEPILYRVRGILPLAFGGIDLTPIVVLGIIYLLNILLNHAMLAVYRAFL